MVQTTEITVEDVLEPGRSEALHDRLIKAAKQAGEPTFSALHREHLDAAEREIERGAMSFRARRRTIERVGLPEGRQHRLKHCDADEAEWQREVDGVRQVMPEIRPLLLMQVAGKGAA